MLSVRGFFVDLELSEAGELLYLPPAWDFDDACERALFLADDALAPLSDCGIETIETTKHVVYAGNEATATRAEMERHTLIIFDTDTSSHARVAIPAYNASDPTALVAALLAGPCSLIAAHDDGLALALVCTTDMLLPISDGRASG